MTEEPTNPGALPELDLLLEDHPIDEHEACATITAAAASLRHRFGNLTMAKMIGEIVRHVSRAPEHGGEISTSAPVAATDQGRSIVQRSEIMLAYLRGCVGKEGPLDAVASILASAAFLRERNGEDYTVNTLRQVEGITSRAAALDRWWPGQGEVQ